MADLSSAQQSVLIELYHAHTVLWDNTLPGYKDQNVRNKALGAIQKAFQLQCGIRLEITDLKTKLQSFRTAVSREMTKLAKSLQSRSLTDEEYVPSYSHWHELQFLTRVIKKRDSKSIVEAELCPPSQVPAPELVGAAEDDDNCPVWFPQANQILVPDSHTSPNSSPCSPSPPPPLHMLPSMIKQEKTLCQQSSSSSSEEHDSQQSEKATSKRVRPATPQEQNRLHPSLSCYAMPASNGIKKRKMFGDEAVLDTIQKYFQSKIAKVQLNSSTTADEDPCNIWAKNLVQDLKKVKNENRRTVLQIKMNQLVQDEILKQIETEENPLNPL